MKRDGFSHLYPMISQVRHFYPMFLCDVFHGFLVTVKSSPETTKKIRWHMTKRRSWSSCRCSLKPSSIAMSNARCEPWCWYIYLHLGDFQGTCWYIFNMWSIWEYHRHIPPPPRWSRLARRPRAQQQPDARAHYRLEGGVAQPGDQIHLVSWCLLDFCEAINQWYRYVKLYHTI